MASKRFEETRIGWMENHANMTAGEYHCPGCDQHFFFIDSVDDAKVPEYCPKCGRRNANA